MPWIDRKQVSCRPKIKRLPKNNQSHIYYNSVYWKNLRQYKICKDPLCEVCLKHDRVVAAAEVHHKKPFLKGATDAQRWDLLLDEDNLISVCHACHMEIHRKIDKYHLDSCGELTDEEYDEAHDLVDNDYF